MEALVFVILIPFKISGELTREVVLHHHSPNGHLPGLIRMLIYNC